MGASVVAFPGLRGGTEASCSGVDGRLGRRNHKRQSDLDQMGNFRSMHAKSEPFRSDIIHTSSVLLGKSQANIATKQRYRNGNAEHLTYEARHLERLEHGAISLERKFRIFSNRSEHLWLYKSLSAPICHLFDCFAIRRLG